MDAVKFIKERDRMCKSYYDAEKGHCTDGCPAYNTQCTEMDDLSTDAEELVALVEEWSAAHPRKTRQSVFLKQWPNVLLDEHGVIAICPTVLSAEHRDRIKDCANPARRCADCRKEFWSQEVE